VRLITRGTAVAGIALLAALAGSATAGGTADKATGGGQILVSSDGRGPGDTIAFTAQERADGTTVGNVNVIDRVQGATGKGVHFKGDVTCVDAVGNTAKLAGVGTLSDGSTTGFTLIVTDNGQGAAADNDMITLQYTDDPTCERQDGDDDSAVELARGNAQVTDGH
jgi:hypothetical protein